MNYESYRRSMKTDLIEGLKPSGGWEIATIFRSNAKPERLIPFNKAISSRDKTGWVHFFTHDAQFVRLIRDPWRYPPILAEFDGVISPDCSVLWNHPRYRQFQSVCQNREIGSWLQRNGVPVIPCVRWGKEDSYEYAFEGIEPGGTVAVGTAGAMRESEVRAVFEAGFGPMIEVVKPSRIVVYGSRRSSVFDQAEQRGIEIVQFDTETAIAFAKRSR